MSDQLPSPSCFISHAEADWEFAEQLLAGLSQNGIPCWNYRHNLHGGQFWRGQIQHAIRTHTKLVLVCSKDALTRTNVIDEVFSAMERERETHSQRLFPIRLDDTILSNEILAFADKMIARGRWREDWVRYVRSFHVLDFRTWRETGSFALQLSRLVSDLRAPQPR